ncbi:hypothetical protein C8Q79DRAFT_1011652 [Trametes meyenii]|nr:hypothetical protein C8Q79DRAFT_1011652 [Trametes meyenii]
MALLQGTYCSRDVYAALDDMEDLAEYMSHLLSLTSSHLQTLCLLQSHGIRVPFIICNLPVLWELVVMEHARMFVRPPSDRDHPLRTFVKESNPSDDPSKPKLRPTSPASPALQRLHIVDDEAGNHPWKSTLPLWAVLAPRLAHLLVSNASEATLQAIHDAVLPTPSPMFRSLTTVTVLQAKTKDEPSSAITENAWDLPIKKQLHTVYASQLRVFFTTFIAKPVTYHNLSNMIIREALDLLPGDVWRIIFATIYIDTGYTAACISRSCKTFKAICVPFQYRIVSLSKVRLIENFIDSFDSALSAATATGEK